MPTKRAVRINAGLEEARKELDQELKIRAMERHDFSRGEAFELLRDAGLVEPPRMGEGDVPLAVLRGPHYTTGPNRDEAPHDLYSGEELEL